MGAAIPAECLGNSSVKEITVRRIILSCSILLLSFSSAIALAGVYDYTKEDLSGYNLQPNLKMRGGSEYSRNDSSVYFYSGYLYAHPFLSATIESFFQSSNQILFTPKATFPTSFNGFEIGVGKELTRYIELETAYLQEITSTKTSTYQGVPFSVTTRLNGLLTDAGVVINPDDQFQVIARFGALMGKFYNSGTANGIGVPSLGSDQLRIEPTLGMDLVWNFSRQVGFHVGTMYIADTHTSFTHGQMTVLAALRYTL